MRQLQRIAAAIVVFLTFGLAQSVFAQEPERPLQIATVTRAPFSMPDGNGGHTGFSIELLDIAVAELGLTVSYDRRESFADMMMAVEQGSVHGAIANISITASREEVMDFSQPIFDGGVQVMLHPSPDGPSRLFSVLFTRDVGVLVLFAMILLLAGGMLMWVFERKRQPYFDLSARDAVFPAFWWALNIVVNGGFEERMPRSRPGRVFGVVLVIASLFIVSIFVAQITAALTVNAIQDSVESLNDLDGRRVGTIEGSTTAQFLDTRGVPHLTFDNPDGMFDAFETDRLDAVVFDGPILAYYAEIAGPDKTRLLERVYRPERYGMALPTGSIHREPINQIILRMREDGRYDDLLVKWFGNAYTRR
ncbi:MAG: transporter substrate-binding domain-containing protein [Pseudomonadota bacterium]